MERSTRIGENNLKIIYLLALNDRVTGLLLIL